MAWGQGDTIGGSGLQPGRTRVSVLVGMRGVDPVAPRRERDSSDGVEGQGRSGGWSATEELVRALQMEGIEAAAYEVPKVRQWLLLYYYYYYYYIIIIIMLLLVVLLCY